MTGETASADTVAAEKFFTISKIYKYVYKCIYTIHTVHIYSTSLYVQLCYRHTLHRMVSIL